jgi:hypothetical protein
MASLYKKDAKIVLFENEYVDNGFSILITNADIHNNNKKGNYSCEDWFEFQKELDLMKFDYGDDEWYCTDDEKDRLVFKEELEKLGFLVVLGEDY